jgi:hypothetical protein
VRLLLNFVWPCFELFDFASQAAVWNTFGPIGASLQAAFPGVWTDGDIAMQGNWGMIMYAIMFVPTSSLRAKFGIFSFTS